MFVQDVGSSSDEEDSGGQDCRREPGTKMTNVKTRSLSNSAVFECTPSKTTPVCESSSAESCFEKDWSSASTNFSGRESSKYLLAPAESVPSQPVLVKTSRRKERIRDKEEDSPKPAPGNQRTEDRTEAQIDMEVGTGEQSEKKSIIKEKERRPRRKKVPAITGRKGISLTLEEKQEVDMKKTVSKDSILESRLPEVSKTKRSGGERSEGRKRLKTKIPEIPMQSKRSGRNSNVKKEEENSVPINLHSAGQPKVCISRKEQELSRAAIEEEKQVGQQRSEEIN